MYLKAIGLWLGEVSSGHYVLGVGVIVISALWVVECRYRGVLFFECYIN